MADSTIGLIFCHMKSRLGVILSHALKLIIHLWLTDLVTLRYDVHYNAAQKMAKP